jgi:uncharacterized membrane protein YhaH (DUF805 family)
VSAIRDWARLWLTFERPVDRATYLRHGAVLTAFKYAVDVLLVRLGTGAFWTPWSYLSSAPVMLYDRFAEAAPWLAPTLVVWTLPFLWIGVSMSLRRALDAGLSAWLALLFFVPLLGYLMVLALLLAPTERRPEAQRELHRSARRLPAAMLAIAVGAALGLGMLVFTVRVLATYGLSLFMGTPFVVGVVTAFLFCQTYPASRRETFEVVAMTSLLVAGAAFALGTEGAICLLMLMPLGLGPAFMGAVVGRWIATYQPRSTRGAALLALALPLSSALEDPGPASVREVVTALEIDASPEVVWRNVVAFPPLAEPTEPLFRLGIAYPVRAEIHGEGVGAIRECVFSTGSFVEPITAWEPGRRLAFDVVASPPPLRELTPYRVDPPHLDGYLVPVRGEFRLVPLPNGRTRLEGSTWYEQRLRPEGYWVLFSDAIISRIHTRVLEHIAAVSAAASVDD